MIKISKTLSLTYLIIFSLALTTSAQAQPLSKQKEQRMYAKGYWKITAYCACKKCCGPKAQGLTASGKRVKSGMVACNVLKFGTKVRIQNMNGIYIVEDRGARRLFDNQNHIDIFMPDHKEALKFGIKWLKVTIIK